MKMTPETPGATQVVYLFLIIKQSLTH